MNNKVIILCYFGKLPVYFNEWLKSCGRNKKFDFLIFSDQNISSKFENVRVIKCDLKDIKELIKKQLEVEDVCLEQPYKLCDYKPLYGVIFEHYIKKYDFWGMCDVDMIFGNLENFLQDDIFEKYDKIYQLGHLTFYRNTFDVNNRFKLKGYCNWEYVISTDKHCRLCERGMMKKYDLNNIPVYKKRDYADISKIHRRYQLSNWLVPKKERINEKYQIFYYENGQVFRAFYKNGNVYTNEYNYIHFQKRNITIDENIGDCFFITNNTFKKKVPGKPSMIEIKKLNPYYGWLYELMECILYEIKTRNLIKRYWMQYVRGEK